MSRQLPARASLEHLRNEAKQRLEQLRTRDAAARLADAQLVVAREYGFASWRQLEAAVDQGDDLLAAVALKRYDLAVRMPQEDPARIGRDGRDTIALHVLVAKKDIDTVGG